MCGKRISFPPVDINELRGHNLHSNLLSLQKSMEPAEKRSSSTTGDHPITPHVALIAVQIMFGTWPIFGKVVLRSVSSTSLVGFRIFGAAIVFSLIQRKLGELRYLPRRVLVWLVLSSLLGVVLNQLLFVRGLSLSTAINATLLTSTIPVVTLSGQHRTWMIGRRLGMFSASLWLRLALFI